MIDARWQRCVQNAPRRWRDTFALRIVRCNAVWLLFTLTGLRYAAMLSTLYAGFERMLEMLVDGVKGQRAAYTACFVAEPAELASRKTLAI